MVEKGLQETDTGKRMWSSDYKIRTKVEYG